jgi:hypothetical protein
MLSEVEKAILEKLFVAKIIGGRHISADNVPKGFPKHLRGAAKDALKSLIKKGYIIAKPTSYGLEVSLNPNKMKEINALLTL